MRSLGHNKKSQQSGNHVESAEMTTRKNGANIVHISEDMRRESLAAKLEELHSIFQALGLGEMDVDVHESSTSGHRMR